MITNIQLRFGRSHGAPVPAMPATPVTVFVGPNNSGKSTVLRELSRYCTHGRIDERDRILRQVEFTPFSKESAIEALDRIMEQGSRNAQGAIVILGCKGRNSVSYEETLAALLDPNQHVHEFCRSFSSHFTLLLDASRRMLLVMEQEAHDLHVWSERTFQILFTDGERRSEVRRIVYEAFDKYLVIDPTLLGKLRIRLSARPPIDEYEEMGLTSRSIAFHAASQLIDDFGDGVKAFVGIITEVVAGDPRVLLIDEPEAFLHPSIAHTLGKELSKSAASAKKSVFASTHSPAFLMGCIQSGVPVTIVRLTYRDGVSTARVLENETIVEMMRHPLLRSTGVLSALFFESVIITEADADRAFYQEVNDRLLECSPSRGISHCLFLNAQNKQTVQTLLRPLRQMGIPAACIVDIDVLKEGGKIWTSLLAAANVPEILQKSTNLTRSSVKAALEATGKDMKRDGGVTILPGPERDAAESLLTQLAEYGIFVVAGGEVESWLKDLGACGHGPPWLIDIFERMGADPLSENYLSPAMDDVWSFIEETRSWLLNPTRKGIPE